MIASITPRLDCCDLGALATLDLASYETTNVAVVRWGDADAAARLAKRVWAIAEFGTLVRVDRGLSDDVAQLTAEHGLERLRRGLCRRRPQARRYASELRRTRSSSTWASAATVHADRRLIQACAWRPGMPPPIRSAHDFSSKV